MDNGFAEYKGDWKVGAEMCKMYRNGSGGYFYFGMWGCEGNHWDSWAKAVGKWQFDQGAKSPVSERGCQC